MAKQSFTIEDMENSGICCKHCEKCKDGKCQDKFVSTQEKRKKTKYHACLVPAPELLSAAIDNVRHVIQSGVCTDAKKRYLLAIVERYEGAPKKQVVMDHRLYAPASQKRKNTNSNFSHYFRTGLGFLTEYMNVTELALLAKWFTDDGIHSLYDWNPFETSVDKLKKAEFNRIGREMLQKSRRIIMDGEAYQILDQENGSLFVVQESPDIKMTGVEKCFTGSEIEHYLNTSWLEQRPEVHSRLVYKVRLLTSEALSYYGEKLFSMNEDYWIADMSEENNLSGMGLVVKKGTSNTSLKSISEKAVIRPAFWIAPNEEMEDVVQKNVTRRMEKENEKIEKEISGEPSESAVCLNDNFSISQLLAKFKESEDMIFSQDISPKETELFAGNLSMQLREIFHFSRLDKEDFLFLTKEKYKIRTTI